jgi:hypothetical protein
VRSRGALESRQSRRSSARSAAPYPPQNSKPSTARRRARARPRRALRGIPDSARGWQATEDVRPLPELSAISVFDADKVGKRCEFCGSSSIVPYEQVKDAFRPESLLPMKISESNARDLIRAWYGRQWLAPNAFRLRALTDTAGAVYLPYWTFDASVHANWTA